MAGLTLAQQYMLQKLKARETGSTFDRWSWGSSSTNSTGNALKKRGLVTYVYDKSKHYSWGRWELTEAGRQHAS